MKKQVITNIPKALAYASGYLFDDYIHDMKIVQKYAVMNRKAMADELIKQFYTLLESKCKEWDK